MLAFTLEKDPNQLPFTLGTVLEQLHSIASFKNWNHVKSAFRREISLSRMRSSSVWIHTTRLHWTSTGTVPSRYTLESDHKPVRIADPYRYGPTSSSVNGKPICARFGIDPFGSLLV